MRPVSERRRYIVAPSLIDSVYKQNYRYSICVAIP